MSQQITAVTFDIWDTIVIDDSDEIARKEQGLRSKPDERRFLMHQALNKQEPISHEDFEIAFRVANAAFNKCWKGYSVTWTVEERMEVILNGLGRTVPKTELADLIEQLEVMEVDIAPLLIDGAAEAIEELASRYTLGIVSDTIVTPGCGLRVVLENYNILHYFSGFAFSDEVRNSKPHHSMFDSVAAQMGTDFSEMVHIGDRDHNDVKGPQALGMKAVLFTASRDRGSDMTSADAICDSYKSLPGVIDALANGEG